MQVRLTFRYARLVECLSFSFYNGFAALSNKACFLYALVTICAMFLLRNVMFTQVHHAKFFEDNTLESCFDQISRAFPKDMEIHVNKANLDTTFIKNGKPLHPEEVEIIDLPACVVDFSELLVDYFSKGSLSYRLLWDSVAPSIRVSNSREKTNYIGLLSSLFVINLPALTEVTQLRTLHLLHWNSRSSYFLNLIPTTHITSSFISLFCPKGEEPADKFGLDFWYEKKTPNKDKCSITMPVFQKRMMDLKAARRKNNRKSLVFFDINNLSDPRKLVRNLARLVFNLSLFIMVSSYFALLDIMDAYVGSVLVFLCLRSGLGKTLFFFDLREDEFERQEAALEQIISPNDPDAVTKLFYLCFFTGTPFMLINCMFPQPISDLYGMSSVAHVTYTMLILRIYVIPCIMAQNIGNNRRPREGAENINGPARVEHLTANARAQQNRVEITNLVELGAAARGWHNYELYQNELFNVIYPSVETSRKFKYLRLFELCRHYTRTNIRVKFFHVWSSLNDFRSYEEGIRGGPGFCYAFCPKREVFLFVGWYQTPEQGLRQLANFPGDIILSDEECPKLYIPGEKDLEILQERLDGLRAKAKALKNAK